MSHETYVNEYYIEQIVVRVVLSNVERKEKRSARSIVTMERRKRKGEPGEGERESFFNLSIFTPRQITAVP